MVLLAVVLGASACRGPEVVQDRNKARLVVDDLGNKVNLPEDVTRVVSLAPNLTEIIFAVGAGDKLVGVTTFCNYPESALALKKVGDTLKPNIESIVGLKPQVVFVTTASQLESFFKVLKQQNIQVFVTNPDSVEGVFSGIKKIGQVVGREAEARSLVGGLQEDISRLRREAEEGPNKKGVFVQIDKSLYTIGKGSFISDALSKIGYRPVTDGIDSPYPKISKERARVLNPDLIIISESLGNDEPNDAFRESSAVRSGRVFKIDADKISRPGPRFVEALEEIVKHDRRWKEGEGSG